MRGLMDNGVDGVVNWFVAGGCGMLMMLGKR